MVSDIVPVEGRASMLGARGMLTGLLVLVASSLAGVLWNQVGAWAPFALGAEASVTATSVLFMVVVTRAV